MNETANSDVMDRQKAIDTLYDMALELVRELGLTEYEESELNCGIWDSGERKLSDNLRKKYGEMKELLWHNGKKNENTSRWERSVELGFRFSSPELLVMGHEAGTNCQTLAKIELSDWEYINGKGTRTGNYRFSESQFWHMDGYKMQLRLMSMWAERGGK